MSGMTTLCGRSSWFLKTTCVPGFTVMTFGLKLKLSIVTVWGSAARTGVAARMARANRKCRISDLCQRMVGQGQRPLPAFHHQVGDAEHGAQPVGRHGLDRAGRRRGAGRRLREGGRGVGVEGDMAF